MSNPLAKSLIRAKPSASLPDAGGEMGRLIQSIDWSVHPMGPPTAWSPALCSALRFVLANRAPMLIWWGLQFRQFYNDAACPILGPKHPQSLGQPIADCWPERLDALAPLIQTTFAEGAATCLDDLPLMIARNGHLEETHFALVCSPLLDDTQASGIGGVLATFTDIPPAARSAQVDRKRYEDQLSEVRQRLETTLEAERSARREAERLNRMKDEFLATLGHELRTPLNAIVGWSQLLSLGKTDQEDLAQGLDAIQRNARVQTQLIEDLLDMSRIVSGKVRLDVQKVNLTEIISAAVDVVKPAADAKGVRFSKVIDPQAGAVKGDPSRLQQVVWNLLSNAVKFTPAHGKVHILLEKVNANLEISVSDTGRGIKPEFLPHLFERFRQEDSSTTRKYGGLGLGLSIVKHLVEMHGGSVRARSAGKGKGATFTVSLPLASIHDDDDLMLREHAGPQKPEPIDTKLANLSGIRILVVDDEPDARQIIKRILTECNAQVQTAESADEALKIMADFHPNVLVSDIGMPESDGYDLIRKVRALPAKSGGQTPAVALTAFARSEDRRRALLAGYQMHVAKPVEPAELLTVCASLAGRLRS